MSPKVFDPLEYLQIIDPSTIIRPAKLQLVANFSGSITSEVVSTFNAWLIEQHYTVTEMAESNQGPGTFYTKSNDTKAVFIGVLVEGRAFVSITHGE